ncbi:hypothetical protein E3N88_00842 [Mikania micrantha]|uniref:Uncharacterized protein n=1 Tax=Mikania micrantha TaxID=192012 RepID=A0A5N6Q0Y6_9ASTR|nr:hypothetical protein E3N88_00842 [Mikania micrantha]
MEKNGGFEKQKPIATFKVGSKLKMFERSLGVRDDQRTGFCSERVVVKLPRIGTLALNNWGNMEAVQQALNVHQGMVGKFEEINSTLHYNQGKNDTICYAYDIFSSYSYHKKLSTKSCRALIFSGDHDLTFPYVGVEQWIASLNLEVEAPWKPFYVDNQVGGYLTKYVLNNYSLTYATVKGAGHVVEIYKPKEAFVLVQRWFSSQALSSDS